MTREDFEDEVYDVASLVNFCNDHSFYDIIEDIYSEDVIHLEIKEQCGSLREICHLISSIDDFSEEYYYYNDNGYYENVDNDLYSDMYDELIERYEHQYGFDEEDEEDDDYSEGETTTTSDNGYIEIKIDEFEKLLI